MNTPKRTHRLLVAEDDGEIRQALDRILTYEGYEVITANDGAAALEAIQQHEPEAILLDVMMPFVDGLGVCRKLRERGDRTPVLMLTARQDVSDRVAGLDAGADDYVTKPFELEELLARVRALLRRVDDVVADVLAVGPFTLDVPRRLVTGPSGEIDLTRTEFSILELLMRNAGIVLERSVMYDQIWGFDFADSSRSLDVHIGYLRRKLEADGTERIIDTVRGVGFVYRVAD
ncbi:MAG: response regulator transcription factor [Actinomycetota bacterium]